MLSEKLVFINSMWLQCNVCYDSVILNTTTLADNKINARSKLRTV